MENTEINVFRWWLCLVLLRCNVQVLTCPLGLFGDMCTILCHCLNGAACDQETLKCNEEFNTGLSLCEPGYVSSTGDNLDNCQTYEGCFDSCTKTCHCNFGSSQCNVATGVCLNGCKPEWIGASCQIGIVEFTYLKTNPNQPVSATCTVTGDPVLLVQLVYHDGNGQQNGKQIQAVTKGMFLVVNYEATPPQDTFLTCIVSVTDGGQYLSSYAYVTIDYYDLPFLNKPPSAGNIFDTSVLLLWDAWNTNDFGDGPVIAYKIYYTESEMWVLGPRVYATLDNVIFAFISALQPGTTYSFYVTVMREGDGGEGLPSPQVTVTTIETQPAPPTIPMVPTTRAHTITPVPTTPPITTKALPTLEMTTQKLPTDPKTPVGRTSAVGDITEPGVIPRGRSTTMAGAPKVPSPPTDVTTSNVQQTQVTVEWNEPIYPEGTVTFYHIDYKAILDEANIYHYNATYTNSTIDVRGISDTHQSYTLHRLEPATVYEVFVSAENNAGEGKAARHVVFTDSLKDGTSVAVGASVAAIVLIVIVIIIVIIYKRRTSGQSSSTVPPSRKNTESEDACEINVAFGEDYEDVDLDETEYEHVISSKWDITWEDLRLTGNILGKGNFGEVQLGGVRINNKWIKSAIKTLKPGTPESEKAKFKEEFKTMTKISLHPHVVNMLGSCEHAEFVPNGNLRKFIRRSRKEAQTDMIIMMGSMVSNLDPKQLLNMAIGVAKGMVHLATSGIIHRDLAARNVLVGKNLITKVADFGMSRGNDIYVQTTSQRVPTRWLSIESLTMKIYTTKSDVWSFGILLWEIATFGGTPYSNMDTKHLAYQLTDGYRMPKPDNCESDMYELMLKCWQFDPEARPSFRDIVNILTDMISDEKIYMSTHYYKNFKFAAIKPERDDN